MNRLILPLAALAASMCTPCLASTDCVSTISSITVETDSRGAGYVVVLESGLSFAMAPESPNYRDLLSIMTFALSAGREVTARFATNSVDCHRVARRTDLIAIVLRRDGAPMAPAALVAPTPAAPTIPKP